jgi:hypothetical protein
MNGADMFSGRSGRLEELVSSASKAGGFVKVTAFLVDGGQLMVRKYGVQDHELSRYRLLT